MFDGMLEKAMEMAIEEDKEALEAMFSEMGDGDKAYFRGYVAGYVEAVRHMRLAEVDGFAPHTVKSTEE